MPVSHISAVGYYPADRSVSQKVGRRRFNPSDRAVSMNQSKFDREASSMVPGKANEGATQTLLISGMDHAHKCVFDHVLRCVTENSLTGWAAISDLALAIEDKCQITGLLNE